MKKTLLILGAAVTLGFTACNSDDSEDTINKVNTTCVNVVTSIADGYTEAKAGVYNLVVNINQQTVDMNSAALSFSGMGMELAVSNARYITSGYDIYLKNITGTVTGSSPQAMTGTFLVTPWYYPALTNSMEYLQYDLPAYPYNGVITNIMVASYKIGNDYLVRTFQPDTFFQGNTTISSDEGFGTYSDITFRLVLNSGLKLADLIIYKARFTTSLEENEKEAVILKDLDVVFSEDGITISGSDIVPEIVVGKVSTPDDLYTFNDIKFQVGGDLLNKASVTYTVGGKYKASFIGDYLYDEILKY